MNETKQRSLTSFLAMFEEIKRNFGIDILNYDSFEQFKVDFLLLVNSKNKSTLN